MVALLAEEECLCGSDRLRRPVDVYRHCLRRTQLVGNSANSVASRPIHTSFRVVATSLWIRAVEVRFHVADGHDGVAGGWALTPSWRTVAPVREEERRGHHGHMVADQIPEPVAVQVKRGTTGDPIDAVFMVCVDKVDGDFGAAVGRGIWCLKSCNQTIDGMEDEVHDRDAGLCVVVVLTRQEFDVDFFRVVVVLRAIVSKEIGGLT